MEKITIKVKGGRIYAKGKATAEHTWLASQKLALDEVEPTKLMLVRRKVHKFFRCVKFALTPEKDKSKGMIQVIRRF